MTPSRVVLAFSCVSLGLLLTRCGDDECKENCDGPLVGLTVIAPDQLAEATCAPAQIVQLDGGSTVRPTSDTRLALSGDASWYADSACLVRATSATQAAGSRGAVAYLSAKSAGRLKAQARGTGVGGEAVVEARAVGGAYTSIRVGGVRYADVASCVPIYVAAADSAGAPASVGGGISVLLSAPGTSFFETEGCTQARNTFVLSPGHESMIAYARFGVPGDVTVTASVGGNAQGSAQVNVEGDPQYRVVITPAADTALVQAGECKSFAIAIADQLGAPLAVSGIDVAVRGLGASVFADAACAGAPITTARVSGTTPTTVYVRASQVGSASFTASLSEAVSRTIQLQVSAAAASALRLGGSSRLSQNGCYPFVVERVDAFGNLVTGATVATTLTSTLGLYSDSACTGATTAVSIPDGEATGKFFVRGASLGNGIALGATATGLTAASKTVDVIAAATAFRLELGRHSAQAGDCVPARLYSVNGDGIVSDVLVAETPAITPTPSGLVRYRDINCSVIQGSFTIPALGSQVDFYVRATEARSYSLATTGGTLTAAPARDINITAGPFQQTDVYGASRVNFRTCTPIYVDFYDRFGNPVTLANGRLLAAGAIEFGEIYDNPACSGAPQEQITVPAGSSSTVVYYRGDQLGNDQVFVGAEDVSPGSASFEVLFFMSDLRLDLADLPRVREVALSASGDVLYALTVEGMVHRSDDNGATWTRQCTTNSFQSIDSVGSIFVSPTSDAQAYLANYTQYYRVESLDGGNCPSINDSLSGNMLSYYQTSGITVDATGVLWAWVANQLYRSTDAGRSWTAFASIPDVSTYYTGHMIHHPTDANIKLVDFFFANANGGLYQSGNGGVSFTPTAASGFGDYYYVAHFDPGHPGYAYKNGRQSTDNGATWTASAAHSGLSVSWAVDTTGAAYRFTGTSSTTVLERAPDARTPVWAALADGTLNEPFLNTATQMSVAGDGTIIAMQAGGSIYLTIDAGTNIDRVDSPGTFDELNPNLVIVTPTTAYAATANGMVYATTDGGTTWNRKQMYSGVSIAPFLHVNPSFPQSVYMRSEQFFGTYNRQLWSSQDGFDTASYDANGSVYSYATVGAVSQTDPQLFYLLGGGFCRRTVNGGVSYEERDCSVPDGWYASAIGWVSPTSPDLVYLAAYDWNIGGPNLFTYDWGTDVFTRIDTPAYPTAGLEFYEGPSGPVLRITDVYGRLQSSIDGGATFTAQTNGTFDNYCYYGRQLVSLKDHPEVVATACPTSGYVSLSVDGGQSWSLRSLGQCQVRQISLLDGLLIASCNNRAPQTLQYDTPF